MSAKTIFIIFLTVFMTVCLMQNTDVANFKFLVWDMALPKLVVLTGAVFIGFIFGLLVAWRSRSKKQFDQNYYQANQKPYDTLSPEDRDYISE